MAGECVWHDICPVCKGQGQIDEINDERKDAKSKNSEPGRAQVCPNCKGKKVILIVKKLRKDK